MSESADGLFSVGPARRNPDKPNRYADSTRLALGPEGIVVTGLRGERVVLPVALRGVAGQHGVASIIWSRARVADKAGTRFVEHIELLNRERMVLCRLPADGWEQDDVSSFASRSGVPFTVETVSDTGAYRKTYLLAPGATELSTMTRLSVVLAVAGVLVLVLGIFALLVALAT